MGSEVGQHKWVESTLGHGTQMCAYCKGTHLELMAIGKMDRCEKAPAAQAQAEPVAIGLTELRRANIERQAIWCPDEVPDLSFRANELGGEVGEALNVIKKLERERHGWRGSRDTVEHLAEELADVVICADLCAITAGINLADAVTMKFNATSDKVGIPVHLHPTPSPSGINEGLEKAAKICERFALEGNVGAAKSIVARKMAKAIRSAKETQ